MKKLPFSLDREFIKWFYEEVYPELGSNRSQVYEASLNGRVNADVRDYWMRQAYTQGAYAMWQELNETLGMYACATEGLDPEMLEPCEVYDRARESLHHYVCEQLELFK